MTFFKIIKLGVMIKELRRSAQVQNFQIFRFHGDASNPHLPI